MLTLKQITEQTEQVIAGLKKKHFKNAEEAIAQAIKLNDDRKKARHSWTTIWLKARCLPPR